MSARPSPPPIRVGVVGTGALGFHHARLLSRMPGVGFSGIYDKNPARAAEVAQQLGTVAHPTMAALLDRVDAVTVAVPTPAHAEVGRAVLERGIALLMEKPLADTLAGAEDLVRCAAEHGVVLQVGHVERFNRAVRAAAPYLDEPRFLQIDRLALFQPRGTDVAVILDLMIHDLDLVLELVRAPVTDVRATGVAILTPHVDIANARLEFANGAIANVTASRVSRERTRKLRIFQPTGYCSLDLAQGSGDFFRLKPGWQGLGATKLEQIVEHVRLEAPEAEPLRLELESFVRAVRGEEDVVVSGAAGAQALALAFRVAAAVQASPLAPPAPPPAPPVPHAATRL
ncbi:MAG TPA: Gfo/Idh/MocA family oxidoreductase [Gemmatimonadales bacterium]|nr:Gfo/Idh/MocA family oxidoreductase [Gemmatimonadales bacterium]